MRMNMIAASAALLLAIAAPATVLAESAPATLSLDAAVDAALRNNLSVKSASAQARIQKRASDFSFDKFYPTVSLSATAMKLNQVSSVSVPVGEVAPNTYDSVYLYEPAAENLALKATVQETFSPAFIGMINQSSLDYQSSLLSKAKAERQIAASVKKLYYQLLVQRSAIELTRTRLENANERLRQAKVAYDLGQGTELNYLYAKQNADSLVPDLRSMETSRAIAKIKFRELLGFDAEGAMELEGDLDDATLQAAAGLKEGGARIDVREADALVEKLKNGILTQNLALLPNLVVQYSADPTLNGPTSGKLTDSANWNQSSGGISVTLAWDISGFIPGSAALLKRTEAKDQLSLARESADEAVRSAMRDEENQARLAGDSLAKIENLKNVVAAARRSYELTDASWKAGVGRYLDLQSAEISYQSSQIQLLNERLNFLSLVFDCEAKYLR